MKPILIGQKTQGKLLAISGEINRLISERDSLLTATMEAHDVVDPSGYQVAPDFSKLIPPKEPPKTPEKKIPSGKKRGKKMPEKPVEEKAK